MAIGSPPPATIETTGLDAGQEQRTEAEGNLQEEQAAHTPEEIRAKSKRRHKHFFPFTIIDDFYAKKKRKVRFK
ncbi:unnamed protein product [Urochloa humidicola]